MYQAGNLTLTRANSAGVRLMTLPQLRSARSAHPGCDRALALIMLPAGAPRRPAREPERRTRSAGCGTSLVPRREHARFCSASCRAAWNREHTGDLKAGTSALQWSITAMSDTTERLPRMAAWDRPRAFAVIGEAVWWVTIVDATLVRHHPDAYDAVMAGQPPGQRELIDGT